jgi:hypothetical protein
MIDVLNITQNTTGQAITGQGITFKNNSPGEVVISFIGSGTSLEIPSGFIYPLSGSGTITDSIDIEFKKLSDANELQIVQTTGTGGGPSIDTNFAITDLTLDNTRIHDGNDNEIFFNSFNTWNVQTNDAIFYSAGGEIGIDASGGNLSLNSAADFILNIPSGTTANTVLSLTNATTNVCQFVPFTYIPCVVVVSQLSDLPATLADNTTYLICGTIKTITNQITFGVNSAIIGLNKENDQVLFNVPGLPALVSSNNHFTVKNLTISNTTGSIFDAFNYTVASPSTNYGRDKYFTAENINFQQSVDLGDITGFDVVDFLNCIFTAFDGTTGLRLKDISKLQITSCEFIRWFQAASFSTAKMIEFIANGPDNVGQGAVNITGCIIHPQQTQIGISFDSLSTTSFGLIGNNTFVTTGLTTGSTTDIDVNTASGVNYIVSENQGQLNLIGKVEMRLNNNALTTALTTVNVPVQINGGTAFTFPVAERVITTNTGTIEGNLTRPTNFFITLSIKAEMQNGGTNQTINFYLANNGVVIPYASISTELDQNTPQTISFSVNGVALQGNVFSVYVENATNSGTDILISDLSLSGFGL